MATDIAFAVGILVLLGNRVPKTLMTFLVALAIVDDLGAVLVIALFYTEQLVWQALIAAVGLLGLLVMLNLLGIRRPMPYFLVGTLLWMALLESGVHATLAGVLMALTIPSRGKIADERFSKHVRKLMDRFDADARDRTAQMHTRKQKALLEGLKHGVELYESPLRRLENSLHVPVAFVIIPLFALVNAGIPLPLDTLGSALGHPVTIGVMVGLVLGKALGIAGLSMLAVKLGIGQLPAGMTRAHLIGIGLLGGVGFTMSIFIAELGFAHDPEDLLMAKTGILLASLIAGVAGYLWLRLQSNPVADGQTEKAAPEEAAD
jgi:NhaA family Na+:H+ antiporter